MGYRCFSCLRGSHVITHRVRESGGAEMLALHAALAWAPATRPWMDRSDPPSARAAALLKAMTLDEKIGLFHGSCGGYVGNVCENTRLGIPARN